MVDHGGQRRRRAGRDVGAVQIVDQAGGGGQLVAQFVEHFQAQHIGARARLVHPAPPLGDLVLVVPVVMHRVADLV